MKSKILFQHVAAVFIILLWLSCKSMVHANSINSNLQDTSVLGLQYGKNINSEGKEESLSMDIYYPKNAIEGKVYPMVMLMHGGGFLTGNKDAMAGACKQFADSGFVAVTINYRKGWNALSRVAGCEGVDIDGLMQANYRALQDAHAAMRFLAGNAKKFHIDPNWVFIGGSSAGAVTALNLVYLTQDFANQKLAPTVNRLGKIDGATNSYKNVFKVKGICNMWGALPDSNLVRKGNAVPMISYHGTADKTVPYDKGSYMPGCDKLPELFGSASIHRRVLAAGEISVLNTSIGGKHGPVEHTRAIIVSNAACFFRKVMVGKAKSAANTDSKLGCRT